MAIGNIYAAPLAALPDGRLMLGAERLSRSASERLRAYLAYDDGSLPSHVGLRETEGGRELWRIEDGASAAVPWPPVRTSPPVHDDAMEREMGQGRPSAGRVGVARHRYIMTPAFEDPLPEFDEYA